MQSVLNPENRLATSLTFCRMVRMKFHLSFFRAGLLLWLALSQSATAQVLGNVEPQVRLSEEGRIYVGDTYTGLAKLSAQLKKDGFKTQDQITVQIPQNTSPNALAAISKELANNGFRRFIFSKPRKTVVEKGVDPLLKDRQ
jgi:hypothetical protein